MEPFTSLLSRLRNDVLCVEWDVKPYTLTHLSNFAGAGTIGKRFDKISLENVEENRRTYRQLLFKAGPEMAKHISGVIMFDETFFQKADDGTTLVKVLQDIGVIPGIKVDKGTVTLAGTNDEFTTQGSLL